MSNAETRKPTCRDWQDHEWKEEYYGTSCTKCGMFFPHGQAPWDPEPEGNPELEPNCIEDQE